MTAETQTDSAGPAIQLDPLGNRVAAEVGPAVRAYDFRNPVMLTAGQLAQLRELQTQFARQLATRLSLVLKLECVLGKVGFSESTFAEFRAQISERSYNCTFKAEPLRGLGQMTLPAALASTVVDRLLGGPGVAQTVERELTEIECALLDDMMVQVLEEWFNQWGYEQALLPAILGGQRFSGLMQSSSKTASFVNLSIEMTLGGATGPLSLCVPEVMVEPLVRSFQSRQEKMQPDKPVVREPNWHPAFEDVLVPITAHWNAFTLTLAEVSNLEIGSVLPLPISILEQTSIVVGSEEKFIGTIGIEGERIAVSITSAIR